MSDDKLNVCGASFPIQIGGQPMAICTEVPGHEGEHRCMIDYKWHDSVVLSTTDPDEMKRIEENPPEILRSLIRSPKGEGQRPYIEMVMDKEIKTMGGG